LTVHRLAARRAGIAGAHIRKVSSAALLPRPGVSPLRRWWWASLYPSLLSLGVGRNGGAAREFFLAAGWDREPSAWYAISLRAFTFRALPKRALPFALPATTQTFRSHYLRLAHLLRFISAATNTCRRFLAGRRDYVVGAGVLLESTPGDEHNFIFCAWRTVRAFGFGCWRRVKLRWGCGRLGNVPCAVRRRARALWLRASCAATFSSLCSSFRRSGSDTCARGGRPGICAFPAVLYLPRCWFRGCAVWNHGCAHWAFLTRIARRGWRCAPA